MNNKAAVDAFLRPAPDPSNPIEDQDELVSERFVRFRNMYSQMAKAVEQTADSVFITDTRGIIEYVNPAFEKITGYPAAEALGRRPSILKSGQHDAAFYCGLWGLLNSGRPFQGTPAILEPSLSVPRPLWGFFLICSIVRVRPFRWSTDAIVLLTDGITDSVDFNESVFGTAGALDFIRRQ